MLEVERAFISERARDEHKRKTPLCAFTHSAAHSIIRGLIHAFVFGAWLQVLGCTSGIAMDGRCRNMCGTMRGSTAYISNPASYVKAR